MNRKVILVLFISVFILKDGLAQDKGRPNVEYTADGLRDPFEDYLIIEEAAPALQEGLKQEVSLPLPSLSIQGIIWGGRFPQAIINNKVVKVGDTIEGARITDINKNGVLVFFENREYNLSSPAALNLQSLEKNHKEAKNEGD